MIVTDSSVVVELLRGAGSPRLRDAVLRRREVAVAPHLLDAEVGQALRGLVLGGRLTVPAAQAQLAWLPGLRIRRLAHGPFLRRAFAWRDNVTVYDGLFLAVAEGLDATLLTQDSALAAVPGCRARVDLAVP